MTIETNDSVQPKDWFADLPRKSYENLEKVDIPNEWFGVYKLPHNVYAIYELNHFQEVISFLIIGSKSCILLDTGMGIGNIKEVIDQLTTKEVRVVNSHCHFDHVGDNDKFSHVYIFEDEKAVNRLKRGYDIDELKEHLDPYLINKGLPDSFDLNNYYIKPVLPHTLKDGEILDLGDRKLEVIHTPGHSPDSIMLLDREHRILFTGDTFYPAALYAHFDGDFYGNSNFETYLNTMKKISKLAQNLELLYCSHNEPIVEPNILYRVVEAFEVVINGSSNYKIVDEKFRQYTFEGFSIITPDEDVK